MDIVEKALKITSNGGDHLSVEDLSPSIFEYLGRVSPLWSALPKIQANGITHSYVRRTAIPRANFEKELTEPNFQASTYSRNTADLKILRVSGGVSGFQQAVSQEFVNALEAELTGSLEGLAETLEWTALYGNVTDVQQFNGIEAYIQNDATAKKLVANGGSVLNVDGAMGLNHLDAMLDAVRKYRNARSDRYVFLATPSMVSRISGLQTRISRDVQMVDFESGFRVSTYRNVPVLESGFLAPLSTTSSPTVAAAAAAGGALADGTYHYAVVSVTPQGEQLMGVVDDATTATTNNSVDLTWTADANALLYKIYRGTSAGADDMGLLDTIPALTYDSTGAATGVVQAYSDEGAKTPNTAIQPLATGEENVFLVNLNSERGYNIAGMLSPLGERTNEFFKYIPLATRKSAMEYMIEGFLTGFTAYPELNVIARRAKLA